MKSILGTRGICQGYPFPPMLCVVCLEPLLQTTLPNKRVKRALMLEPSNKSFKVSAYAVDVRGRSKYPQFHECTKRTLF